MTISKCDRAIFEKNAPNFKNYILLCFQTSSTFDENLLKTIEEHCQPYSKILQTYLINEDELAFFQKTFRFWGTPIYILLHNGKETGRLLGKVSEESVSKFLFKYLSKYL